MAVVIDGKEWVDTTEAAARMGCVRAHVNHLLRHKLLEGMKLGRDWQVSVESIAAYLATDPHPGPKRGAPRKARKTTREKRDTVVLSNPVALLPDEEWITAQEARGIVGVTDHQVRKLARDGTLRSKRFGRSWMISRTDAEWYAKQDRRPGPKTDD